MPSSASKRTADCSRASGRYSRGRPHPITREAVAKRRNPPMLRMDGRAFRWLGATLVTAVVMTGCSHTASKTAAPGKASRRPHTPPRRHHTATPPPTCPDRVTGGSVPNRPALAIKVENARSRGRRSAWTPPTSSTRSPSKEGSPASSSSTSATTPPGGAGAQRPPGRPVPREPVGQVAVRQTPPAARRRSQLSTRP